MIISGGETEHMQAETCLTDNSISSATLLQPRFTRAKFTRLYSGSQDSQLPTSPFPLIGKMKEQLISSSSSSSSEDEGDLHQLTVNEHYAKAFQYRKEREELAK